MGNWEHKKLTNSELKELVREVYDLKIYTSLHCKKEDIIRVFMPVLYLGAKPSVASISKDNQINRKNKLKYINDCLIYEAETPQREEFINNCGMLYEYYSEAAPRGVNGMPFFYSCKIVSIEDTKKFNDMYNEYVKVREEFEKNWDTEEVV